MTHLLAILASLLGFACLCASMSRHQKVFLGRHLVKRANRGVRIAGWALLAVALAIDMTGFGPAYGVIAWFGHLTLGAALVLWRLNRKTARAG